MINQTAMLNRSSFILLLYTLILAVLFGAHPIFDYDTWWHLATGRWIAEQGRLPFVDPFSYTALGKPWVNHEWLSQIIFWKLVAVTQWFGAMDIRILPLFSVFLFWVILFFVAKRIERMGDIFPVLTLFLIAFLMHYRVMVRPHLFSLVGFTILFFLMERKKWDYALPILFLFWANLHGEALFGFGLLGLYWLGSIFDDRGTKKIIFDFHTFGILLLCALALLINPHGYGIATFPFEHLGLTHILADTSEWHSPFTVPWRFHLVFQGYFVLLGAVLVFLVSQRRKLSWATLLVGGVLIFMSIKSNRNTAVFALWVMPLLYQEINERWAPVIRRLFPLRAALVAVLGICLVLLGGTPRTLGREVALPFGLGALPHTAPFGVVDYLKSHDLVKQRIFNDLEFGGFLILEGIPVFIDGRTPIYGDEFYQNYRRTRDDPEVFQKLHDQWKFSVVLLFAPRLEQNPTLAQYLDKSPHWKRAFADEIAVVYVQQNGE